MSTRKVLLIALALLATLGAGVAAAEYSKSAAAERMVRLAHWKAACGQGYWRCQGWVIQGPYGPAHGDPEWTGTVIILRHKKKSVSWQTCHVEVDLNHDESTHQLAIDCEYALTAPDRPHAASWS